MIGSNIPHLARDGDVGDYTKAASLFPNEAFSAVRRSSLVPLLLSLFVDSSGPLPRRDTIDNASSGIPAHVLIYSTDICRES